MRQEIIVTMDSQNQMVQQVVNAEFSRSYLRNARRSLVCVEFVLKHALSDKNLVNLITSYQTGGASDAYGVPDVTGFMGAGYSYGSIATKPLSILQVPLFQFLNAAYTFWPGKLSSINGGRTFPTVVVWLR